MHKVKETKLREITNNIQTIRESFGKWVDLFIDTDSRVIVKSKKRNFFRKDNEFEVLGELSKTHSKSVSNKMYSGKIVKARLFDFCPVYITAQGREPVVRVSLWEN